MRTLAYCLSTRRYLTFVFIFVLLLAAGCKTSTTNQPPQSAASLPKIEDYAIVSWIDNNNERKKLSDYAGKVVVLDFYATWCEPCRQSIPKLNALQKQNGPAGLTVVGLNVGGADDRIKVNGFAKELNIQYALGFPDKPLTDLFFADDETIPQTFVFSREGQLTKRFLGFGENTGTELEHAIEVELQRDKD